MSTILTDAERAELIALEEAMWRPETRFDRAFQQQRFADDFIEFGRSGRIYTRSEMIIDELQQLRCVLPLPALQLRQLDENTVQITYDSYLIRPDGVVDCAHRSSLWSRSPRGWVMRFHQGTPFVSDTGTET